LRQKFLIVDDSPTIRLVLKGMVERLGVPPSLIRTAESGQGGIEAFQEFSPDVVFLDIEMPGVEGHDVCRAMLGLNPLAKIVAITGCDRNDPRVRNIIGQGGFDVVEKPLRLERVTQVLDSIDREGRNVERIR
jgi:CheY-like chemotaxis protein